jgi:hypothetical protein
MNTQGFYKFTDEELFYGPNFVSNANYELIISNHEEYSYPIDGWYYFESEELAREFFGLPAPVAPEPE